VSGIIKLLPETIANQIAAGEVVQRPASVVKELLENSIDAGAGKIRLVVEQAGKTLIEVSDDGCGMSPTDARLCFERHATSKISTADDLFRLKTMGFRGEALASIAAVARVELITRPAESELGTRLVMEGGKAETCESAVCPAGTCIRVKNLFFNVPARRQFLKDNATEWTHIVHEFERVALAFPKVKMELVSNGNVIYSLAPGNFFQRITALFGSSLKKNLIFFEEKTDYVHLTGYASSPQTVLKRKKEQFFFVNNRYIRSPYLSTAVYDAYRGLIPEGTHPQFFIKLEVDPATVDVNIHPTKTEVKFRYEKELYAILLAAIKRGIGKNAMRSELDFQTPEYLQEIYSVPVTPSLPDKKNNLPVNTSFLGHSSSSPVDYKNSNTSQDWKILHAILEKEQLPDLRSEIPLQQELIKDSPTNTLPEEWLHIINLFEKYILLQSSDGVYLADRQRMHERVLFEQAEETWKKGKGIAVQQLLIPEEWELSRKDLLFIRENKNYFLRLGFDIEDFGKESLIIQGVPSGYSVPSAVSRLEELLEQIRIQQMEDDALPADKSWCLSFARTFSLKPGQPCSEEEITFLVRSWMQCGEPLYSPKGKPVLRKIELPVLDQWFKK